MPSRIECHGLEFTRDPLSDRLVQLPELGPRELGEFNSEHQPLIPLSSVARAGWSFPREFAGATRRYLRSSSRSDGLRGPGRSHTGRIRTSRGSPVPWTPPQEASLALS